MINRIEKERASPRSYHLIFNNCLAWALDTVSLLGIGLGGFSIFNPPNLVNLPNNVLDKIVLKPEFEIPTDCIWLRREFLDGTDRISLDDRRKAERPGFKG